MADAIPVKTVTSKLALPTKSVASGVALPALAVAAGLYLPTFASTGNLVLPVRTGSTPAAGPTWDPAKHNSDIILSNGNLTATNGGNSFTPESGLANTALSGKTAFKVSVTVVGGFGVVGIGTADYDYALHAVGDDTQSIGLRNSGAVRKGAVTLATITGFVGGDSVTMAVDPGNKAWFEINGVWNGDPVAGTGGFDISSLVGDLFPAYTVERQSTVGSVTLDFDFAPPTGFTKYGA